MRPVVCVPCGGSGKDPITTRKLPCTQCAGKGVVLQHGVHDPWAKYRACYHIAVTPKRLALEDSLEQSFPSPR